MSLEQYRREREKQLDRMMGREGSAIGFSHLPLIAGAVVLVGVIAVVKIRRKPKRRK